MRRLALFAAMSVSFASLLAVDSCTPSQRAAAPAVERASCILLRAITDSGTVEQVCATADELAPFIGALAAAQEAAPPSSPPTVAFALPLVRRSPPARRHCAQWIAVDAGAEAAAP